MAFRAALAHNASELEKTQGYRPLSFDDTMAEPILLNPEAMAQDAFNQKQAELAQEAKFKKNSGVELTAYEREVRTDARVERQRYWKQMGGYAAGVALAVGAVFTAPVSLTAARGYRGCHRRVGLT